MEKEFIKDYENCILCPRKCGVNRYETVGYCRMPAELYLSKAYLHKWEEPPISGEEGSGTVFFTGCSLKCIYCQNYKIALGNYGTEADSEKLSEVFLKLQEMGANNINLVTPSHYTPTIAKALKRVKEELRIPVVYNTSSYDSADSLRSLEGLVDIYLADFKYYDESLAEKYSNAPDYVKVCKEAVDEMFRQQPEAVFDSRGMMKRGIIVRHLMLPGHLEDSRNIVKYLYDRYGDSIYLSLMNQFTPVRKLKYDNLNDKVSDSDYDSLIDYAVEIGVENAFIQEGGTVDESFIPDFNLEGIGEISDRK